MEQVIGIEPTSWAWRAYALTVVLYLHIFNINILPESSLQNSNLRYCVTKAVSLSSRRKEQQWHAKGELTPRFELGLKPYQGLVLDH